MPENILLIATLPLPPSINRQYKSVTRPVKRSERTRYALAGKAPTRAMFVKTDEAKAFVEEATYALRRAAANIVLIARVKAATGEKMIGVAVTLTYYFETRWRRDIDGGDKAALDVVFKYMGVNDNRIVDMHVKKFAAGGGNPRLEVEVRVDAEFIPLLAGGQAPATRSRVPATGGGHARGSAPGKVRQPGNNGTGRSTARVATRHANPAQRPGVAARNRPDAGHATGNGRMPANRKVPRAGA